MAITIETTVSIDTKPQKIKPIRSNLSKKGDLYPDSLELTYIDISSYIDADGNESDLEMNYIISINGSANLDGVVTNEVVELNKLLRAYDYKKYPLQLTCELFEQGRNYASEVGKFVSDRDKKQTVCLLSAKELLEKLKKS